MTERERWIVYPLLFLALGAALRDKLIDQTTTKSLVCQELIVVDEQPLGREPVVLAKLGRAERTSTAEPPTGQMLLNGHIEIFGGPNSFPLIAIGPAKFPDGTIGGSVAVNGQVLVNGAINANVYAYQGQQVVPVLRGGLPGASLPSQMLQAVPHVLAPTPPVNSSPSAESPQTNPTQPESPPSPLAPQTEDAQQVPADSKSAENLQ